MYALVSFFSARVACFRTEAIKSHPAGGCFGSSKYDEQSEDRSGNDRRDHDEGVALKIAPLCFFGPSFFRRVSPPSHSYQTAWSYPGTEKLPGNSQSINECGAR